jgi:hypothetical protein
MNSWSPTDFKLRQYLLIVPQGSLFLGNWQELEELNRVPYFQENGKNLKS